MADVEKFREIIISLLKQYGNIPSNDGVDTQIILDIEGDHYQLVHVGWLNNRRIYGCVLHLDIIDDKVWVQHNGTEIEIGTELAVAGIPKKNIVIGFHAPYKRKLTDYAVA